ncbi:hypothetical protein [Escherichia coli]
MPYKKKLLKNMSTKKNINTCFTRKKFLNGVFTAIKYNVMKG